MKMHDQHSSPKHGRPVRTLLARLVLACMLVTLLPAPTASAVSPFQDYADKLSSWNVMRGYSDGDMRLDEAITRAQFVAMVNRGYGYTKTGPTPFQDVEPGAWYANDISIAYTAGYFSGRTATTAAPNDTLSREQALTLLARSLRLEPAAGEVTSFTDGDQFSSYSKGYADAAVKMGIISGYPDGSFRPQEPITRGQMAKILANSLGTLVQNSGTSTLGDVYGNVTVNTSGATLKDTTIAGNLYISGGLDLGAVTLDNVRVLGDIIVAGGGESESGQESVILRNTEANNLLVDNLAGQYVSLRSEGSTHINNANIRSSAYVLDRSPSGYGLLNINLDDPDGNASYTLSGNLKNVVNQAPSSSLTVSQGTVQSLTVDEKATNSTLNIDTNTSVKDLSLDVAASVTGSGDVDALHVNAAGSSSAILPDEIDIRPGIVANIFGETMDTKLGEESSADPRILAGYPKAQDVAPTSATGVFSCNKTGTLYWAVSSVTDGSIGEEELIKPSTYGSKAIRSGNLQITGSNLEHTAAITGLTKGGSYYLSAILVDARGARSPLKVISFGTPDDSVPNFVSGSPAMSLISGSYAQASVMPTKSCKLYYALYEKGSTAPTPEDFRTSSLAGSLENGSFDVTKNFTDFVDLGGRDYETDQGYLEELASYDLYLWLNDADNGKSSAVKKLTFTTVDKTPPRFVSDLQSSDIKATSVSFVGAINEKGTVYWVVVPHDSEYPKPAAGSASVPALSSEQAKFQVAQGLYGLKSGKVSAKEGTQFSFSATGLQGETAYDLYYVAQDAAGNYSEEVQMLTFHTLDDKAPTVTQAFNKYEGEDASTPYAYTDVQIIFSEDVQQASTTGGSLADLYKAVQSATSEAAKDAAKTSMRAVLSSMIKLYDLSKSNNGPLVLEAQYTTNSDGTATRADDDWVIDYREATITLDEEGRLVVTFPYGSGIRLASGASYQFTVEDVADTSEAKNKMGLTRLDKFTTISSQVAIDDMNMFNRTITVDRGDSGDETVKIHGAVKLDPISTESVTAGKGWDLLIWTDCNLTLTLYCRTHTETASGAVNGDPAWRELGTQNFVATGATGGFIGASLTYNFEYTDDVNTFEDLKELDEDTFYDFAFRIISLDGSTDEATWSKTVNFRFNVVSGDGAHMSQMAHYVEKTNYDAMVPAYLTDLTVPADFTLSAPFMDTEAPYFAAERPEFEPGDTYVDITHQLNRDGTIYYVIAPVSLMPTTWTHADNEKPNVQITSENFTDVPEKGLSLADFDSYKDHVRFPLETPSYLNIINPTYRNNAIKTGTLEGETGQNTDRITGLTKETDYICYFVIRGAGRDAISVPQAFRFKTTETQRPAITLQLNGTTAVNIRTTALDIGTNVSSTISYALVRDDESRPGLLDTTISGTDISYLEAMVKANTKQIQGGSYIPDGTDFDKLANDGSDKEQMLLYITGSTQGEQGSSGSVAYSENNVSLASGQMTLDLSNKNMKTGINYVLLVVANNNEGSGYAFAAIRGLHLDVSNPPQISAEPYTQPNPTASGDKAYGSIYISLNDSLYNYNQSLTPANADTPSVTQVIDIAPPTGDGITRTDNGAISLLSLADSSDKSKIGIVQGDAKDYNKPISYFYIRYGYINNNDGTEDSGPGLGPGTYSLTISPSQISGAYKAYFIAGAAGGDTNEKVTITLNLKRNKTYVTTTNSDGTTTTSLEYDWSATVSVSPNSWIGW